MGLHGSELLMVKFGLISTREQQSTLRMEQQSLILNFLYFCSEQKLFLHYPSVFMIFFPLPRPTRVNILKQASLLNYHGLF